MFGKRILILVAHPDDEVVAQAASIVRARAQGAEIFALYLTNGCIARETLWPWQRKDYDRQVATRRAEAETAGRRLGLTSIGWSVVRPARHLWRELPDILREVEVAVGQCRPDQIWAPAYEGGNPDHDALNAVASFFRAKLSVLEFAEYNYLGGQARSNQFISPDETVRVLDLTPEEAVAKRDALALYASERGNLFYIACEQESYRPLARYDYGQPPHQGRLWYTRFQWVPFSHPRVDYTQAREVSAAIKDFFAANRS
jgi:LmbE family N-acetylglucosaminyl deacetylase